MSLSFSVNSEDHRESIQLTSTNLRNLAVSTYKPDLTTTLHQKYAVEEGNIRWTRRGLVPEDHTRLSSITFPVKSTWNIVGADIEAEFHTGGKVYFAVTETVEDTVYTGNLEWNLLQPGTFECDSSGVEDRMAYWVKFVFEGKGAGLAKAEIATEVQMSHYTMPGLLYGRHIYYRVGGNHTKTWSKPLFYWNIKEDPEGGFAVKVEVFSITGEKAGQLVRALKDEHMKYGASRWYGDGLDYQSEKCPVRMYSCKVTGEVTTISICL